jgi:hypothetical protein
MVSRLDDHLATIVSIATSREPQITWIRKSGIRTAPVVERRTRAPKRSTNLRP